MAGQGDAASTEEPLRRWSFGPAVLDERTLELAVNGDAVSLERKQLEVLLFLLNHAGEVVTRDEILEAVWPGRILTETVLTKCIHKLREALGDEDQSLIKTQHGYGYRLVAQVKVEASTARPPPRFAFKRDDRPPLRPLWKLIERLGTGGHGEAWLARHEKTGEARVFKFADTPETLVSLKREITLYRLLRDTLGERPDFVHILDWNLEEAPYFFEGDYTEGGNLIVWAERQGGLRNIPLATRLDLAAQIAEALAAAHSVGVLHKDLKPSNVLIEAKAGESPRIKLADFGSGGVLDLSRLEALGITRLGFTHAVKAGTTSGTPLYFAPEVIAGQPFTVQADIYALGVMLYQMVVGDLHRPLAPGWEKDIEDELVRDDIAQAAEGHPAQRLPDALLLARRLRTLEDRRQHRAAAKAAQARLRTQRNSLIRMRARRRWLWATVGLLFVGVVTTATLYIRAERSRDDAVRAAAITQAVSDFLNKDLLAGANPWKHAGKDLTVREVLVRAADQVDDRFSDQPEVAAQIHATLGETYAWLGSYEPARVQLEQAAAMFERLYGPRSKKRLTALSDLSRVLANMGRIDEGCAVAETLLADSSGKAASRPALLARLMRGRCLTLKGDFGTAAGVLKELIDELSLAEAPDAAILDEARLWIMWAVIQAGEYREAEQIERSILQAMTESYGAHHIHTALQRFFLGLLLTESQRYGEAEVEIQQALHDVRTAVGHAFDHRIPLDVVLGHLRLEEGRLDEAVTVLEQGRSRFTAVYGPAHPNAAVFGYLLGEVLKRQGRLDASIGTLRSALRAPTPVQNQLLVIGLEPITARIALADALRMKDKPGEAWTELDALVKGQMANLPERHPILAELRRVQGLLWLGENQGDKARAALAEALQIHEFRYGADHWRSRRAREDLAQAQRPS